VKIKLKKIKITNSSHMSYYHKILYKSRNQPWEEEKKSFKKRMQNEGGEDKSNGWQEIMEYDLEEKGYLEKSARYKCAWCLYTSECSQCIHSKVTGSKCTHALKLSTSSNVH